MGSTLKLCLTKTSQWRGLHPSIRLSLHPSLLTCSSTSRHQLKDNSMTKKRKKRKKIRRRKHDRKEAGCRQRSIMFYLESRGNKRRPGRVRSSHHALPPLGRRSPPPPLNWRLPLIFFSSRSPTFFPLSSSDL